MSPAWPGLLRKPFANPRKHFFSPLGRRIRVARLVKTDPEAAKAPLVALWSSEKPFPDGAEEYRRLVARCAQARYDAQDCSSYLLMALIHEFVPLEHAFNENYRLVGHPRGPDSYDPIGHTSTALEFVDRLLAEASLVVETARTRLDAQSNRLDHGESQDL